MRTLRLLFTLLLIPVLGNATEITSYQVRLKTDENGSGQGIATVQISACKAGSMNLPLGFTKIENLKLEEAPTGVRLELGPSNGQLLLHAQLPEGAPSDATLRFSFSVPQVFLSVEPNPGGKPTLPKGSRLFRHTFVNTQEGSISSYRFEVIFPAGTMAQAIREQLPKPKRSEALPRVLLAKIQDRQAAILQFTSLKQGDDTSMLVELVPARKSLGWLIVGLIIGVIYLFFFRDLVARKHPDSIPAG